MIRGVVVGIAVLVLAAGCAGRITPVEQRTTQGPTAEEFWTQRVMQQNRREPTFEEKRFWQDQLDERIAVYLRAHPEASNRLDLSTFRFLKQVTVGMDREQVTILLGPPAATTTDAAQMQAAARRYWPDVRSHNPTEAWMYPQGWTLYFDGARLVDITQYMPAI